MNGMRNLLLCLMFASVGFAQPTSPCGTAPHCVVLTWSAGLGGSPPTSFNILRSDVTGGPYTQIGTTPATILSYTDMSGTGNVLTEGSTYFYVIQATNSGGNSPNSAEAAAKIPFLLPSAPTFVIAVPH